MSTPIPEVHSVNSIWRDGSVHTVSIYPTLEKAHEALKRCIEQHHMVRGVVLMYCLDMSVPSTSLRRGEFK